MPKQTVNNIPGAVPRLPTFSQAVISNGNVYVSGSVGCDAAYNVIGGIQEQTKAALDNMKALLEGAGSGLEYILKVTVYLADMPRDFEVFNQIYTEYFADEELPARMTIGVVALPLGALVGVDCIAELAPSDDE
ncbi:yabJ protein [Imleria badia]|nr:yabJ protein [Imleria badia]